jgi:LPS O-antigen subunit length determinant protein (WzzB/FepE family)
MTVGAPTPALLKHGMYAARALALAVDVVRATASTAERPSRADAQALVSERLQQFTQRLHQGVAEHFRRGLVAKSTPAAEN